MSSYIKQPVGSASSSWCARICNLADELSQGSIQYPGAYNYSLISGKKCIMSDIIACAIHLQNLTSNIRNCAHSGALFQRLFLGHSVSNGQNFVIICSVQTILISGKNEDFKT